jgi:hypothetical protein
MTSGCLSQCGGGDLAFGAVKSGFCEQSDMSLVSRIVKAFRGDRLSREIEEAAASQPIEQQVQSVAHFAGRRAA